MLSTFCRGKEKSRRASSWISCPSIVMRTKRRQTVPKAKAKKNGQSKGNRSDASDNSSLPNTRVVTALLKLKAKKLKAVVERK